MYIIWVIQFNFKTESMKLIEFVVKWKEVK